MDYTHLPEEIWLNIFSYLNNTDILQVRLVCKQFLSFCLSWNIRKKWWLKLEQLNLHNINSFIMKYGVNGLPQNLELFNIDDLLLEGFGNRSKYPHIFKVLAPRLRSLKVSNAKILDEFNNLKMPQLEKLHLKWVSNPKTRSTYRTKLNLFNYPNLKKLSILIQIEMVNSIRDILQQLLEIPCNLIKLEITYFSGYDGLFKEVLKKYAPTLKYLYVSHGEGFLNVCRTDWFRIVNQMKNLESITLSGFCLSPYALEFFNNVPESAPLRKVKLIFNSENNSSLLKLITTKWPRTITSLDMYFNKYLDDYGLNTIWDYRQNLKNLKIRFFQYVGLEKIVHAIARDKNCTLRKLQCTLTMAMNEESICQLACNLTRLEILDLSSTDYDITDRGLTHISRYMTTLRQLSIYGIEVTSRGIAGQSEPEWDTDYPMKRLHRLEKLSLNNFEIIKSDAAVHLAFPHLRSLSMPNCKKLLGSGVIEIVKNCPVLERLELHNCVHLNDDAYYYICKNLPRLKILNITGCKQVSEAAKNDVAVNWDINYIQYD